jgi:hypothetical protein
LISKEKNMKKLAALFVSAAMVASMVPVMSAYANETETPVSEAPDYSQEDCWLSFPEISEDVDTFYIYSTQFMGKEKDDPNFAPLDNPDMVICAHGEYVTNASAYEDSTNVFSPYYRQASMRYA